VCLRDLKLIHATEETNLSSIKEQFSSHFQNIIHIMSSFVLECKLIANEFFIILLQQQQRYSSKQIRFEEGEKQK
jgi:hypothetical protein